MAEWFLGECGRADETERRASRETPGFDDGRRYQLEARAVLTRGLAGAAVATAAAAAARDPLKSKLLGTDSQGTDGQAAATDATAGARMGPRTLCVWAVHDGIAPIEAATQLRDALPGSTLCLFDSGHWPIMAQEAPEPFCRMLVLSRRACKDVAQLEELSEQWLPILQRHGLRSALT